MLIMLHLCYSVILLKQWTFKVYVVDSDAAVIVLFTHSAKEIQVSKTFH